MSYTETTQTAKCHRCGRTLRAAASIRDGYGRGCKARIRAAAIAQAVKDFAQAQVDKARELIADRGLIATTREGVFRAVSSNGTDTYLTHAAACNCPAGLRGRQCYHRAAVAIFTAA